MKEEACRSPLQHRPMRLSVAPWSPYSRRAGTDEQIDHSSKASGPTSEPILKHYEHDKLIQPSYLIRSTKPQDHRLPCTELARYRSSGAPNNAHQCRTENYSLHSPLNEYSFDLRKKRPVPKDSDPGDPSSGKLQLTIIASKGLSVTSERSCSQIFPTRELPVP